MFYFSQLGEEMWKPFKKKSKVFGFVCHVYKNQVDVMISVNYAVFSVCHKNWWTALILFFFSERLKMDNSVTQDDDDGGKTEIIPNIKHVVPENTLTLSIISQKL